MASGRACILCGSTEQSILYRERGQQTHRTIEYRISEPIGRARHGTIVKCNVCGLVFLEELPHDGQRAYRELSDPEYHSENESRTQIFKQLLSSIESDHFPHNSGARKLLDIGCATGTLLRVASEHGWIASGVEPSRWAVDMIEAPLRENVFLGTFEDTSFPDDTFDLVVLWETLEHIEDPSATLRKASRILRPGGIIVINIPNIESFWSHLLRDRWWLVEQMHYYYFEPRTIRQLLENSGFSVISIKPFKKTFSLGYLIQKLRDVPVISDFSRSAHVMSKPGRFNVSFNSGQMVVFAYVP